MISPSLTYATDYTVLWKFSDWHTSNKALSILLLIRNWRIPKQRNFYFLAAANWLLLNFWWSRSLMAPHPLIAWNCSRSWLMICRHSGSIRARGSSDLSTVLPNQFFDRYAGAQRSGSGEIGEQAADKAVSFSAGNNVYQNVYWYTLQHCNPLMRWQFLVSIGARSQHHLTLTYLVLAAVFKSYRCYCICLRPPDEPPKLQLFGAERPDPV